MLGWCDCLDDDHLPATTWARQPQNTGRLFVIIDGVAFIVLQFTGPAPKNIQDLVENMRRPSRNASVSYH